MLVDPEARNVIDEHSAYSKTKNDRMSDVSLYVVYFGHFEQVRRIDNE